MSITNAIHLGEIPVCSEAVALPIVATETGTWAFLTSFNNAYQYVQFSATAGQQLVVPARLNEDYTYHIRLYTPGNTMLHDGGYVAKTVPILPGAEYVYPNPEAGAAISTGKIQFLAVEGQTEATHTELVNAKQVAVFIEGGMRHEGDGADEYQFNSLSATVTFNTPLTAQQKLTIIYFK